MNRDLTAFVQGINAYVAMTEREPARLPIEFRILRYAPRPWTAEDSVMIGVNIAESLSSEFMVEHAREMVTGRIGPEHRDELAKVNGAGAGRP